MLKPINGLDHVVIAVRNLAAAMDHWRNLGFTVSPRGLHSAHLGTANHTIVFDDDYVELLGVVDETEFNASTRSFLRRGSGLERLALRTDDATAAVAGFQVTGIDVIGPIEFRRPVDLEDGHRVDAAFRIFQWPADETVEGIRLFAVEHLTPGSVWLPKLLRHANGARCIRRVEIVAPDPHAAASSVARTLATEAEDAGHGVWRVSMGARGGGVEFLEAPRFAAQWGFGTRNADVHCALVLGVDTLETAMRFSEWTVDTGDARCCARVDGALIAWELGGQQNR